ncbi:hypothetical protein CBA120_gp174 [Escherichia phage Cba120]|uniref:Uncharacterized protein n=1 Tax=Escherichia phage Cba120 TaxID=2886902 RepID=G3M1A1_9CAUD|nr:hypothetical protein CBA120_gp174 [Escherichia phage Cba120]AEM91908.1 hypothetical protein [Escherichia phage Cba120]
MATAKITPNASTWTQVSDGTSLKTLQVTHGSVYLCDSPSTPTGNNAHVIYQGNMVVLTPPTVGWVKAINSDATVIVS